MPKIVDHDARRSELTAAALRLVADGGRAAASVRALAAATGWSAGTVRHYVPSSAALETLLLEHVSGLVQQRVAETIERCTRAGEDAVETVARQLEQTLPLDAERRTEYRIWLALYVSAPADTGEITWVWEGQRMFHRQHVLRLTGAARIPGLPGPLDPPLERVAAHLHAYADGLALRIASGTEDVATSLTGLREAVADVGALARARTSTPAPGAPG